MKDVEVYIDDKGIYMGTKLGASSKIVDEVLQQLEYNGLTVNPLKCKWAVQETDWLGFWLTPEGLKPWKKKIKAVL
jgi:hypothetical protein